MAAFSKSGSVTVFGFEGKLPEVDSEEFSKALAAHRFRTIETAANEAESAGWVTIHDPTGDSFEAEDLEHGPALWLRVRMDKKTLPARWVAIYRASAERAAGRKLSIRERRELKEDLMDKLLPKVLPTVRWVDALCFPSQKLLLLMSTSAGAIEAFQKLFLASFSINLEACNPERRAVMAGLDRDQLAYLDQVSPVRWPGQDDAATLREEPRAPSHNDTTQPVFEPNEVAIEAGSEAAAEVPQAALSAAPTPSSAPPFDIDPPVETSPEAEAFGEES